jgi:hypothetical protein
MNQVMSSVKPKILHSIMDQSFNQDLTESIREMTAMSLAAKIKKSKQ